MPPRPGSLNPDAMPNTPRTTAANPTDIKPTDIKPTDAKPADARAARPTRVEGRSRLAVAGSVTIVAVAWWAVLTQAFNVTLEAEQGSTIRIGAPSVLIASLAMSLAGWALLAILEHNTIAARKAWTITATIACALSLTSPLTAGIGAGAKLGLASLHLVVGSLIILGLRRTALPTKARCVPAA
jgi:uncharacterized protein DUF6069